MLTTQTNNNRWTLAFRQIPIQDDHPRGANHLRPDMCKANLWKPNEKQTHTTTHVWHLACPTMPLQAKPFWSENTNGHLGGQDMLTTQSNTQTNAQTKQTTNQPNKDGHLLFDKIQVKMTPREATHLRWHNSGPEVCHSLMRALYVLNISQIGIDSSSQCWARMVTQFRAGIVSPIHALTLCFEQTDRGAKHLRVDICEVKFWKPTDEFFMGDPKNTKSQHAAQRRQTKSATLCICGVVD